MKDGTRSLRNHLASPKPPDYKHRKTKASLNQNKASSAKTAVYLMLALILFSLWVMLYLRGLSWGKPFILHPDEPVIVEKAIKILQKGDMNPHFFNYPSLPIYVQSLVSTITHLYLTSSGKYGNHNYREIGAITQKEKFFFYHAGRLASALFASIMLCLVFVLTRKVCNTWAALAAVGCVMAFPLLVREAHYVTPNVLAGLLVFGSVCLCVQFIEKGKKSSIYWAAALGGLSVGAKYNAIIVIVPVILTLVLRFRVKGLRHVPLIMAVFAIGFIITTPYALLDMAKFMNDFSYEIWHYKWKGHFGAQSISPIIEYLRYFWSVGALQFLLSVSGFFAIIFRGGAKGLVLAAFPVIYILFMSQYKVVFYRNMILIIPFLGVGFGTSVWIIYKFLAKGFAWTKNAGVIRFGAPIAISIMTLSALMGPARKSVGHVKEFTSIYTVQIADKWIKTNIRASAKISTERKWSAVLPIPDGDHNVTVIDDVFFIKPYIHFLSQDFLISTNSNTFDKWPGFKDRVVSRITQRTHTSGIQFVKQFLESNRKSLEKRFELIRRIEKENKFSGDDVYIYKVPRMHVFIEEGEDCEPDDSLAEPMKRNKVKLKEFLPFALKGSAVAPLWLPSGQYDIFIEAMGTYNEGSVAPRLEISIDNNPRRYLDVIFTAKEYYYIGTCNISETGLNNIRISFSNDLGTGHDVYLYTIALAYVSGEHIEKRVFVSEKLKDPKFVLAARDNASEHWFFSVKHPINSDQSKIMVFKGSEPLSFFSGLATAGTPVDRFDYRPNGIYISTPFSNGKNAPKNVYRVQYSTDKYDKLKYGFYVE